MTRRVLLVLAAAVTLLGAGASSAGAFKGFESPSHNIGCIMVEQGVRCDILHHSFSPPRRPKSCEFGYGNSLFVGDRGRGVYGCSAIRPSVRARSSPTAKASARGASSVGAKKSASVAATGGAGTASSSRGSG
jgi:hypothetical protein